VEHKFGVWYAQEVQLDWRLAFHIKNLQQRVAVVVDASTVSLPVCGGSKGKLVVV
jgi:hypothetical protein